MRGANLANGRKRLFWDGVFFKKKHADIINDNTEKQITSIRGTGNIQVTPMGLGEVVISSIPAGSDAEGGSTTSTGCITVITSITGSCDSAGNLTLFTEESNAAECGSS